MDPTDIEIRAGHQSGKSASARETLARLPVINDPVISEAMAALEEENDGPRDPLLVSDIMRRKTIVGGPDVLTRQMRVVERRRAHGRVYVTNALGIRARVHKSRIAWHCYATNELHSSGAEFIALHLYEGSRARICVECWLAGKGPRE